MGYYEFILTAADEAREALIEKAFSMGCLGCYEKGRSLVVYFTDTCDIINLRDELRAFRSSLKDAGLSNEFSFDYLYLSEKDWNEPWKKRFIPVEVGERLSILPPWENRDDGRIHVIIDPGMAFGTGHHETTKACLALIERVIKELKGRRILDVGTGTGILVIAAMKLGYEEGTGVDIDPLAIDAAKRNLLLNRIGNAEIIEGTISNADGTYDLIVANLLPEILVRISGRISARLENSGIAILSGMLIGQEGLVIAALEKAGLRVTERCVDNRWVTLVAQKPIR
jgi:ribosomal protein L11 methyltransferase